MVSFNSTVIARLAAGLYDVQLGNETMNWAVLQANSAGGINALANSVYNADFSGQSHAAVATLLVKNLGITGAQAGPAEGVVKSALDAAPAGTQGAAIVNLLNLFANLPSTNAYYGAATAFNVQINAATAYAAGANSVDVPVHPPVSTFFTLTAGTAAGADVMRLTGNQDVRIDFTNPANQITGLDLNGDGLIKADGVENNIKGKAANFEIVDAYSRNPLNHSDTANNFLGDISYDGTGFQGDGVSTNGNIFLGGLGHDVAFGGIGNDFLAGGGIAQGHGGLDVLSGGRNADFFFAELSGIDATDGSSLSIDGGTTSDNVSAGVAQSAQDADWLLLEASDDDEPVTIVLRDDSVVDPTYAYPNATPAGGTPYVATEGTTDSFRTGYVITRSGVTVGTLRDVENLDASGNLYGFLNNVNVEIGGRAVDTRDVAGTSNYGLGSSAQLRVFGSDVANIIIGGYDNDFIEGNGGADLLMGGNLQQLMKTVTGGVTNPNLALITNDGRDELYGNAGNDNIVFEADGGVISGSGAASNGAGTLPSVTIGHTESDTLWLTDYSLGTKTATDLTTDGVLRFDLTTENGITEGLAAEGGAGYGGSNTTGTADQTNYKTAKLPAFSSRVTVTSIENIDATGLGAIDFLSAGTNNPELKFSNQQNFNGYNGTLTLRGTQGVRPR